jgi:hypothetical protein
LFYYLKRSYSTVSLFTVSLLPFSILSFYFIRLFRKYFTEEKQVIGISHKKTDYLFVLAFLTPVIYLNVARIYFPDVSYDIGSYHLYLQELNRFDNLKNFNMVGSGAGGTYFFTLSYKFFGIFRHLLGFRMGAILNTLLFFVCFTSLFDLIKMIVKESNGINRLPVFFIGLICLFAIWADNTLIIINSYVVDFLGIPILIELLIIVLFRKLHAANGKNILLLYFLLASLLIAYKLTFIPYALVLSIALIIRNGEYFLKKKQMLFTGLITLLFPLLYMIYNYTETQNPIFPLYNAVFKSPLFEIRNFKDERWGPRSIAEVFYYNIVCALDKSRTNEWRFFSVRLLGEYFIIISGMLYLAINKFRIKDRFMQLLLLISAIAISFNYLLLITTGYYRYGIIVEILFGLCLALWLMYFLQFKKYILFFALLVLCSVQSINTFNRIFKRGTNYSWYDYPSIKKDRPEFVKQQKHLLLHDRQSGIEKEIASLQIDGFLSSDCDGYIRILSPQSPIFNITAYGNRKKLITDFEEKVIDSFSQKHHLYFLARKENVFQKLQELAEKNYETEKVLCIYPSFTYIETPLYLFRIKKCSVQQ